MTEAISHSVCQWQLIDNFLIAVIVERRNTGRDSQTRRRRIATEHRMCPIDASVNHRDDHVLALVSIRREPWNLVRRTKVVRVTSVELVGANVRHALEEA